MRRVDPRTPVIVGVGQVNIDDAGAPEPVDLIIAAARRAAEDAGSPASLPAIESVQLTRILSWRYADPGVLVAERLGASVRETVYTENGGQMPQVLINRAARQIRGGELDVVLVAGGESRRTRNARRTRGEEVRWTRQPEHLRPSALVGEPLKMTDVNESCLGITDPTQVYALFEHALRAQAGRTRADHLRHVSELWARFSAVAVSNEHAALRSGFSGEQIRTGGDRNRPICDPYTKLMNANNAVDQAAAVLLCSVAKATALGVSRDRMVFLHGAAEASDTPFISNRESLAASPAIRAAGRAALSRARLHVDDVKHVDLYSCFPSAVQVAAAELGLGLDRDLTVTGGLTFAGGPWNNYVSHAIASMVTRLRQDPHEFGLCSANGGLLSKHAIAVYSCRPPRDGEVVVSAQAEADRSATRVAAPDHAGQASVEAFTVTHGRDGRPEAALVSCLLDDGRRTLAASDEPAIVREVLRGDVLGQPVAVRAGALVGLA